MNVVPKMTERGGSGRFVLIKKRRRSIGHQSGYNYEGYEYRKLLNQLVVAAGDNNLRGTQLPPSNIDLLQVYYQGSSYSLDPSVDEVAGRVVNAINSEMTGVLDVSQFDFWSLIIPRAFYFRTTVNTRKE